MSKEKFTDGEWYALGELVIADLGRKMIKPLGSLSGHISPEEDRANAHLIAAAPDMYREIQSDIDGLKEAMEEYPKWSSHYNILESELNRKDELLAKARGE